MNNLVLAIVAVLLLHGAGAPRFDEAPALAASRATADELDRLLAPIALYPDQLLAQMLLSAANPGKVAALNEWLASHESAKGTELQDAATKSGFEPSFVALGALSTGRGHDGRDSWIGRPSSARRSPRIDRRCSRASSG